MTLQTVPKRRRFSPQVIIRQRQPSDADFQNLEEKSRVCQAIIETLALSYVHYPMRKQTEHEHQRRFTICFEAYKVFRNEMGWSIARCLDNLEPVLEEALTGKQHIISSRSCWFGN